MVVYRPVVDSNVTRPFERQVPPTQTNVTMRSSNVTLKTVCNLGTRLRNCMDDAMELGLPSCLGLYEDVGAAHEAHLIDPLSRLVP